MPTEQQIMDWADALALDIISMVYGRSIGDARRAVAKELRFLKMRGVSRTASLKVVDNGGDRA